MLQIDGFSTSDSTSAAIARNARLSDSFYPSKNYAEATITRANGEMEVVGLASKFNSRTSAGANFWYTQISGAASSSAVANVLALSANSLTIALSDTSLSGQISTNNLAMASATVGGYVGPTATSGTGQNFSYTLTHTWTASGAQTVQSAAVLTSTGTLILEANFTSSISLNNQDSLSLTWSISS